MKPGRELDALIAEKVMGLIVTEQGFCGHPITKGGGRVHGTDMGWWATVLPFYSTDIAAAWEVVERMREKGFNFQIHNVNERKNWVAFFWKKGIVGDPYVSSETLTPYAICLAALKAT